MSGFYELKCVNNIGVYTYYYFYSPRAIRNPKMAIKSGYAPDSVRLSIEYKEETPVAVKFMFNPLEYLYKKYFKKKG